MKFYKNYFKFINESIDTEAQASIQKNIEDAKANFDKTYYVDATKKIGLAVNLLAAQITNNNIDKETAKAEWDKINVIFKQITDAIPLMTDTKTGKIQGKIQLFLKGLSTIRGLVGDLTLPSDITTQIPETPEKPTAPDTATSTATAAAAATTTAPEKPTATVAKGLVQLDDATKSKLLELAMSITSDGTNADDKQKQKLQELLNGLLGTKLDTDGKWGKQTQTATKQLKALLRQDKALYGHIGEDMQQQADSPDNKSKDSDGFIRRGTHRAIVKYLGGNTDAIMQGTGGVTASKTTPKPKVAADKTVTANKTTATATTDKATATATATADKITTKKEVPTSPDTNSQYEALKKLKPEGKEQKIKDGSVVYWFEDTIFYNKNKNGKYRYKKAKENIFGDYKISGTQIILIPDNAKNTQITLEWYKQDFNGEVTSVNPDFFTFMNTLTTKNFNPGEIVKRMKNNADAAYACDKILSIFGVNKTGYAKLEEFVVLCRKHGDKTLLLLFKIVKSNLTELGDIYAICLHDAIIGAGTRTAQLEWYFINLSLDKYKGFYHTKVVPSYTKIYGGSVDAALKDDSWFDGSEKWYKTYQALSKTKPADVVVKK
jgi:hypothetical protein